MSLVTINGVPRFGTTALMTRLGATGERVTIGGRQRMLFMDQASADEVVAGISLGQAKRTLVDALRRLPALAAISKTPNGTGAGDGRSGSCVRDRRSGSSRSTSSSRPDPNSGRGCQAHKAAVTGPRLGAPAARAVPLSQLVTPMTLDPAHRRRRQRLPRPRRRADGAAGLRQEQLEGHVLRQRRRRSLGVVFTGSCVCSRSRRSGDR